MKPVICRLLRFAGQLVALCTNEPDMFLKCPSWFGIDIERRN